MPAPTLPLRSARSPPRALPPGILLACRAPGQGICEFAHIGFFAPAWAAPQLLAASPELHRRCTWPACLRATDRSLPHECSARVTQPGRPLAGGRSRLIAPAASGGRSGVWGDAAQDLVEDRGALLSCRRRVAGSRDVERALVERADE